MTMDASGAAGGKPAFGFGNLDDIAPGRIVGSDETTATLDVDGDRREVAYAEVAKALVQIEFNRKSGTSDTSEDD